MKHCFRCIWISGLLFTLANAAFSADSIKIHLTYKHKLNDAGQTTGYVTIAQQFFTPHDTLFREIRYNDATNQIDGYTFYFYRSEKLFTEEFYNAKDSLLHIIRHQYDQYGYETETAKLFLLNQAFVVDEKTETTYDAKHLQMQQKKLLGKRLGSTIKYQYNANGQLVKEIRTFKPLAKAPVKQETRVYSYDAKGNAVSISVMGKGPSANAYQYTETYQYNNSGWVSSISFDNPHIYGVSRKVYKYLPSGHLSIYEEWNANDKLIRLLQYDYKIHYMNVGTQVSHYENL